MGVNSSFTVFNNQAQRNQNNNTSNSRPTSQQSEPTRPAQPATPTVSAFKGKGTVVGASQAPVADTSLNQQNSSNIYVNAGNGPVDNKKKNDKYQVLKEEDV
jgi:hypothetical protein